MNGLLIAGLLALNFFISWFNCYSVGGMWAESKAVGGFARVLAWCGAIQSAIGFSSVNSDNAGIVLAIVIVAAALLGGVFLTAALIHKYSSRLPAPAGPGWS